MRSKATIFFGLKRSKLNIQKSELAHTLKKKHWIIFGTNVDNLLKAAKEYLLIIRSKAIYKEQGGALV